MSEPVFLYRDRAAIVGGEPLFSDDVHATARRIRALAAAQRLAWEENDFHPVDELAWLRALDAACTYGWKPAGTTWDHPDWAGAYEFGVGQRVGDSDARAFAGALKQAGAAGALGDYAPAATGDAPPLASGSGIQLERLLAFLRRGAFEIW